jgi:hypothetical protein
MRALSSRSSPAGRRRPPASRGEGTGRAPGRPRSLARRRSRRGLRPHHHVPGTGSGVRRQAPGRRRGSSLRRRGHGPAHPVLRAWRAPGTPRRRRRHRSFSSRRRGLLVRRITWLRPPWAFQPATACGASRRRRRGAPQVDDRDCYVSTAATADRALRPVDVESRCRAAGRAAGGRPAILDVDLDGFATRTRPRPPARGGFTTPARAHRSAARERLDSQRTGFADAALSARGARGHGARVVDQPRAPRASGGWASGRTLSSTAPRRPGARLPSTCAEQGRTLVGCRSGPGRRRDRGDSRATRRLVAKMRLARHDRALGERRLHAARAPRDRVGVPRALRAAHPTLEVHYDRGLSPLPRP